MKAVRKEDFNTAKNVMGKEDIRKERNAKKFEQRRENIENRSLVGDAMWTRTNSSEGQKLAHAKEANLKEPKTEKTSEMEESPKIEAVIVKGLIITSNTQATKMKSSF